MEEASKFLVALFEALNRYGQGLSAAGTFLLALLTFLSLRWAYRQEQQRQYPSLIAEVSLDPGVWSLTVENYSMNPVRIVSISVVAKRWIWSRWRHEGHIEIWPAGDDLFLLKPTEWAFISMLKREVSLPDLLSENFKVALDFELLYPAHPKGKLVCRMLLRRFQDEDGGSRVVPSECRPVRQVGQRG